jgi:predicted naringenin-chalcone synthase
MTWSIRDRGFDMTLSGRVPSVINKVLAQRRREILAGRKPEEIGMWAIHPGGRSVLDQVAQSLGLCERGMAPAREVLRRYGNMSSATVMFVLKALMDTPEETGLGCGMAFGPGLAAETFTFSRAT